MDVTVQESFYIIKGEVALSHPKFTEPLWALCGLSYDAHMKTYFLVLK